MSCVFPSCIQVIFFFLALTQGSQTQMSNIRSQLLSISVPIAKWEFGTSVAKMFRFFTRSPKPEFLNIVESIKNIKRHRIEQVVPSPQEVSHFISGCHIYVSEHCTL